MRCRTALDRHYRDREQHGGPHSSLSAQVIMRGGNRSAGYGFELHDLGNGSTGFMRFAGHPLLDKIRMDSIIQIRLTIHQYVFVCVADMARDSSCRSERCLAD